MTDARNLKKEVNRAGCAIEDLLAAAEKRGMTLDPALAERIREDLKQTGPIAKALKLPKELMSLVGEMRRHPRPHELLRA